MLAEGTGECACEKLIIYQTHGCRQGMTRERVHVLPLQGQEQVFEMISLIRLLDGGRGSHSSC